MQAPSPGQRIIGAVGVCWGIGGVSLLLGYAIVRLSAIAIDSMGFELSWYHWAILLANAAFMAYTEGYKGFQKAFSPRVAARVRHLRDHPSLAHVLLAPAFCMGYFHTTRRRLVSAYLMTCMIVVLVIAFNHLAQPWRGVLDAGIVLGLLWGWISALACTWTALRSPSFEHSAELPERA